MFNTLKKAILLAALAFGMAEPSLAEVELGDPAAGKRVFRLCAACHAVAEGQNRIGPSLYNVIGRTAGGIEGFRYSNAHKAKGDEGLVWTKETLDPYLENPRAYIPGNRMAFAGLRNPQQRKDLIAYLYEISPDAPAAEATAEEASAEDAPAETEETPAEDGDSGQ